MGGALLVKKPRLKTKTPSFNITDIEAFEVTFTVTNNDDFDADIFWEIDTLDGFVNVGGGLTNTVTVTGLDEETVYTLTVKAQASFKKMSNSINENFETDSSFTPTSATGGSISDVNIGSVNYRIHAFTNTGTSTFTVTDTGTLGTVDVLVVAGGGSGGSAGSNILAGGGGAGGLVYSDNINVSDTNYTTVVGSGGSSVNAGDVAGNNGGNSSIFNLTALGGGGGGGNNNNAKNGGSGGGGKESNGSGGTGLQPSSTSGGSGNNGGPGSEGNNHSGGGGGAGEPGNSDSIGAGGDGLYYGDKFTDNFGENGWFAGGGSTSNDGKSQGGTVQPAGLGGGGKGKFSGTAEGGQANTGGGGGASQGNYTSGAGGSGIVLIRYRLDPLS